MADQIESSSHNMGQQDAAERSQPAMNATGERSAVAELVEAAQSTAESLLHDEKQRIADRVSGMAAALEGAAHALDQSKNHAVGQYVREAGQQIRTLSHTLQERRWNELITDIEDFARRQPTWFVLGAMTVGFIVGRFLWTAANAPSHRGNAVRGGYRRETSPDLTTAVSNTPGTGETTYTSAPASIGSSV